MAKTKVSQETATQAMKVAKGTARPGQTKEQTKLIAQGIEKGIAEYKKREKAKARERDKERKLAIKQKQQAEQETDLTTESSTAGVTWLPWALLALSWIGFIVYFFIVNR